MVFECGTCSFAVGGGARTLIFCPFCPNHEFTFESLATSPVKTGRAQRRIGVALALFSFPCSGGFRGGGGATAARPL